MLQKQQRQEQQERPVIARNVELLRGAVGRDKPVWVDDTDAHEITPRAGAFQGEIICRLCHIVYGRLEGFVACDLDVKLLAGQRCRPFELELAFFKCRCVKLREGFADAEARGHAEFLHIAIALDDKRLTLQWKSGSPGQTFQLQLARNREFSPLLKEEKLVEPKIQLQRPAGGVIYMRVKAIDSDGYEGPYVNHAARGALQLDFRFD